jgi:molybdate transport system regulatory protein
MTARRPVHHKLVGKLSVETEFGTFLGDTRVRLLEAIERYGSISQAAKAVPLSYKAAWDAVDAMNNVAEEPLVQRSTGGRHGGGTVLTEYGRRVVAMYRAVEEEYQAALDRLADRLAESGSGDVRQFRSMLRRMALRTSARNQFAGPICAMNEGPAGFEVRLRLDDANELAATITRESAENLGLKIGMEVHALVKATAVALSHDSTAHLSPTLNRLCGTVDRIHRGSMSAEVSVLLPSGRSVTAVISKDALNQLQLEVGKPCCALIEASGVTLFCFS